MNSIDDNEERKTLLDLLEVYKNEYRKLTIICKIYNIPFY